MAIYVIGSSNTDMVIKAARLPAPGETIIGETFLMNPGGKGANQAVSAARLSAPGGRPVVFVARVGTDMFGQQARQQLQREGIATTHVLQDPEHPSGVALINVDAAGENSITVAPGANHRLRPADVLNALADAPADGIVLLQLEIPLPTVEAAVLEAYRRGMQVVLNPAPAQPLPADLLARLSVITPNESEAEQLTGIRVTDMDSAERAARWLQQAGVRHVIITLGAKGAYLLAEGAAAGQLMAAPAVPAVDTTAAGDCFNGALAAALSEGKAIAAAAYFACRAAAVSVTRMGAQAAMPYRSDVDGLR